MSPYHGEGELNPNLRSIVRNLVGKTIHTDNKRDISDYINSMSNNELLKIISEAIERMS